MTSIYTFLPLFAGVLFVYIIVNYDNEKKKNYIYLILIFLCFYDLNKGFYLFSYVLLFFVFYNVFVERIRSFLSCNSCIIVIYVVVAYLGHYVVNLFVSYILNNAAPIFSLDYVYYMVIDSLLAIALFKGKT